jgi:hypothetical protein
MNAYRALRGMVVALPFLASGCGGDDGALRVIARFEENAARVECSPLAGSTLPPGEIEAVAMSGDTLVGVLYDDLRAVYVHHLRNGSGWHFDVVRQGPDGVLSPAGLAFVRDSFVAVGDRGRMSLQYFNGQGRVVRSVAVGVPVMSLAGFPGGVAVAPTTLTGGSGTLLYLVRDDVTEQQPVPVLEVPNSMMTMMANSMAMAAFPDGRLVMLHQFFHPVGHVWRAGRPLRTLKVPVPEGTARRAGFVPAPPLTDEALDRIARIALGAAADPKSGDVLLLTPLPNRRGARAVVRLDRELAHVRSYLIDVNAGHLLYDAGRRAALVADPNGQWHSCPLS